MKPSVAQLRRLVGNPDAYAVQHEDGSWHPERKPLDDYVLQTHLAEAATVGTYIGHPLVHDGDRVTVARTLVFDVDKEGNLDQAEFDAGLIMQALRQLNVGEAYTGLEFSGKKGFHVWVPLQEYRPNAELRRVGRAVLAMADVSCEVFPKQDDVRDLGNLVKLPGGVHRVTGKANDFVAAPPRPLPVAKWEAIFESLPPEQQARRQYVDNRFPCLERIQDGVEESGDFGRNNSMMQLATMMRRHGLNDESVELVARNVNEKFDPPMDDVELEQVLGSSTTSGPVCTDAMRECCGDACIRDRTSGLKARGGQLKFASEGERVVVTLASRAGTSVTLDHEDLTSPAKGRVVVRKRDEE